jgi:hypothetical protein
MLSHRLIGMIQVAMPPAWLRIAGGNPHLIIATTFPDEA